MGKVAVLTFFGLIALMIWAAIASLAPQASQALVQGIDSAEQLISEAEADTQVLEAPVDLDPYSLPMTNHALEGHASEQWNANSIRDYFSNRSCYPQIYYCEAQDFEVHYCQVDGNDKKSIALVIGMTVRQIITGFMANTDYWTSRCQ